MNWIVLGMRPKTLVAGIVPPLLAYGHYQSLHTESQVIFLILTLLVVVFIQIATNFYNDAVDFKKGADKDRVGPKRVAAQYHVNVNKVMLAGHIFLLCALIVGVPLVIRGGVVLAILGGISFYLTYGYTGGPFPIAYLGLGEVFVFLFFGLMATCGSYFIFAKTMDPVIWVIGAQLGLLSSTLIAINNFRDRKTDILVGKRTLATRMSDRKYLILLDVLFFVPYGLLLGLTVFYDVRAFFPLFAIPVAFKIRQGLRELKDEAECNDYLELSAKHLVIFSVLFMVFFLWR